MNQIRIFLSKKLWRIISYSVCLGLVAGITYLMTDCKSAQGKERKSLRGVDTTKAIANLSINTIAADCTLLMLGNETEIKRAENYQNSHYKVQILPEMYIQWTSNCASFRYERKYIHFTNTQEEQDFPIAFSIMMYTDVELLERLLRAIYRPQNFYCVHVDLKSPKVVHDAVRAIVGCLGENVFLSSITREVKWSTWTNIEPDLICMRDLWERAASWKYFINLTGQEFPLQTNWQIVQVLKLLKGGNGVSGFVKHVGTYRKRWKMKTPFPGNITMAKGDVHVVLSRAFVNFLLHDVTALAFADWVKNTSHPDETFFQSMYFSPQLGAPGAYTGPLDWVQMHSFPRYKVWRGIGSCSGRWVRSVCVHGVGDLHKLVGRYELFVNKFQVDYQPLAYDCLEQEIFERVRHEAVGERRFDAERYRNRPSFVYHNGNE